MTPEEKTEIVERVWQKVIKEPIGIYYVSADDVYFILDAANHFEILAERDWLQKRVRLAGICRFGKDREEGMSSNAMVDYALGGPSPDLWQYPKDKGDLTACERCRNNAPEHLRARMDEVLKHYQAALKGA